MNTRRPLLEHAKLYVSLGLHVFPCARLERDEDRNLICACWRGSHCQNPGKHPLELGWQDAKPRLARWWGMGGAWNIGIATGAASGIVVLDVDPRHGGDDTLAGLEEQHGSLPRTWRFLTGGGGEHILFQHPAATCQTMRAVRSGVASIFAAMAALLLRHRRGMSAASGIASIPLTTRIMCH
jgi:hypothetical protein